MINVNERRKGRKDRGNERRKKQKDVCHVFFRVHNGLRPRWRFLLAQFAMSSRWTTTWQFLCPTCHALPLVVLFLQPGLLRLPFADDVYVLTFSCCVKRSGLQQDVHSSNSGRGFEPSLTCLDPTVLRTTRLFRPNPPGLSR